MRRQGTVTAVDRANRVVRATIDEMPDVEATYYAGDPRDPYCRMPWPLCNAWFSYRGSGLWHCDGPVGHRRVLFHDDFLSFTTATTDSFGYGDSGAWGFGTNNNAGLLAEASPGLGVGAVDIGGATDPWLTKDTDSLALPDPPQAIHFVGRFRYNDTTGYPGIALAETGEAPTAPGVYADPSAGNFIVQVSEGVGSTIDGSTFTVDEWYTVELVYSTVSLVGWVNGNGPTGVDLASTGPVKPCIGLAKSSIGSAVATFDYVSMALVTIGGNLPD